MKSLTRIFLSTCFVLATLLSSQAYSETSAEKYKAAEHLLDGVSFEYYYTVGVAVKISFDDGMVEYVWIVGPNEGNGAGDIPYQSRKIGDDLYLVNWHEPDNQDFVTLVVNLEQNVLYSSAILRYAQETESIHFTGAIVERVED